MTELLIFKQDWSLVDPTLLVGQLAGLPNQFDVVCAAADGWPWSAEELTHPRWRIVAWPLLSRAAIEPFLSSLEPTYSGGVQLTVHRFRAKFLDFNHVSIPAAFRTWWNDDTRATQKLSVNFDPTTTLSTIGTTRAAVPKV